MHRLPTHFVACLAVLITSQTAHAQSLAIEDRDPNGQSIKLGETDLVPSIRIDFQSTDNTFRAEENEQDSTRTVVSPEVNWYAERRLVDLRATYKGSYASTTDDAPDFTDHLLGFSASAEFNSKNRSTASVSISSEHDEFGLGVLSDISESDQNEVAEYTDIDLAATHTFGARDARGNITGGLRAQTRNYRNQSLFTDGRDFDIITSFAQFGYRVSADTRLIIGGQLSNVTFDNDINDRIDTTLFTGINFAATGKLSGTFRVGATESFYDASNREDETNLYVDADLFYRPSNFALLRLSLRREVDNDRGNFSNSENPVDTILNASWEHQWSSRISTRAAIDVEDFDATCPQPSDVVTTPSFELDFALRRWVSFGISASHENRSVSDCDSADAPGRPVFDYDRQDFGIFIRGTI